jgi:serine/threonine protein kinase
MTIRSAPVSTNDAFSQAVIAALGGEYRIMGILETRPGTAVYLAHRAKDADDFPLALNVCRRDPSDPDRVRFLRALEVTGSLEHPNVLPVRPLREVGGFTFAESRLTSGGLLESFMAQVEPLPVDQVLAILQGVASALDHAHAQGVLHGGLHAGAIGFDAEDRVLVGGFLLGRGNEAGHPALRPSAVGHPAYLSHEQRHDDPRLDGRADQFALGVLAWELFSGERRATYDVDGVLELDPLNVAPTRPLREGVGLHVNQAIRKALAKEPAIRYETCTEFVEALAGHAGAQSHGLPTYHPPIVREERSMLWLVVPVLLAVVAVGALFPETSRNAVIAQYQRLSGQVTKAGNVSIPEAPALDRSDDASGGTGAGSTTYREPEQARPGESRAGTQYATPTAASADPATGADPSTRRDRTTFAPPQATAPAPARPGGDPASSSARTPAGAADTTASTRGMAFITLDGGRAAVFVDGLPRGFTPAAVSLSRGRHVIQLRGARVSPDSLVVSVAGGDSTRAAFRVLR